MADETDPTASTDSGAADLGEDERGDRADTPAGDTPAGDTPAGDTPADASGLHLVDDPDAGAETVELSPPTREEELETQLSELQARLRAVSAAYQQQQEEMDAARARLERQAALKEEMRRGEVVVALFDPVQNLKRSVDAASKGASMDDTLKGLALVQAQFMVAFQKLGLEEVPGEGARFDPNLHEALTTIPVTDPAMDDVVVEVFSAGFRIGSRLIAPARVVVGRLVEAAPEA